MKEKSKPTYNYRFYTESGKAHLVVRPSATIKTTMHMVCCYPLLQPSEKTKSGMVKLSRKATEQHLWDMFLECITRTK